MAVSTVARVSISHGKLSPGSCNANSPLAHGLRTITMNKPAAVAAGGSLIVPFARRCFKSPMPKSCLPSLRFTLCRVIVSLAILLLAGGSVRAQVNPGIVAGTVTDPAGALVPSAQVTPQLRTPAGLRLSHPTRRGPSIFLKSHPAGTPSPFRPGDSGPSNAASAFSPARPCGSPFL